MRPAAGAGTGADRAALELRLRSQSSGPEVLRTTPPAAARPRSTLQLGEGLRTQGNTALLALKRSFQSRDFPFL